MTDRARQVLDYATDEARRLDNEQIGTQHLLLGLLREGEGIAMAVLENLDVDTQELTLERAREQTARLTGVPAAPHADGALREALERWIDGMMPFVIAGIENDGEFDRASAEAHAAKCFDELRALESAPAPEPLFRADRSCDGWAVYFGPDDEVIEGYDTEADANEVAKRLNTVVRAAPRADGALREALVKTVEVVKMWHNMGMGEPFQTWELYYRNAPEMEPARRALSAGGNE